MTCCLEKWKYYYRILVTIAMMNIPQGTTGQLIIYFNIPLALVVVFLCWYNDFLGAYSLIQFVHTIFYIVWWLPLQEWLLRSLGLEILIFPRYSTPFQSRFWAQLGVRALHTCNFAIYGVYRDSGRLWSINYNFLKADWQDLMGRSR